MSNKDLATYIRNLLTRNKISITRLSRDSGISRESIYKILRCDVAEPDLSTLAKLSKPLGTHPSLLVKQLFKGWSFISRADDESIPEIDATGFIADVTYPEDSRVSIGNPFTKTWRIQNLGSIPWIGRSFVCQDNPATNATSNHSSTERQNQHCLSPNSNKVDVPDTMPGECIDISVKFEAPTRLGAMCSKWYMVNENEEFCFPEKDGLSCLVQVVDKL